eukprot:223753_1
MINHYTLIFCCLYSIYIYLKLYLVHSAYLGLKTTLNMGACCGSRAIPPENKPNIEKQAPPNFVSNTSTNDVTNDPQSGAFITPNPDIGNIIVDESEDSSNTQSPPEQQNGFDVDDPNTVIQEVASPIPLSKNNHKSDKQSAHQRIASESVDSTFITQSHEVATNTSISSIVSSADSKSTAIPNVTVLDESHIHKNHIDPVPREKKPKPAQSIANAYLLTRDDIQNWSDKLSKQLEDDQNILQHVHSTQTCVQHMDQCECIQRLLFVLKLYHQCINHKDRIGYVSAHNIVQYLYPYQDYQCVNDYLHFIDHHHGHTQQKYFHKTCSECDVNQCVAWIRNRRDRQKQTEDRYYDCDASDYHLIAMQQILDSIHCAVFHSIVFEKDHKRKMEILREKRANMFTIQTPIDLPRDVISSKVDENESKIHFTLPQLTNILQKQSNHTLKSKEISKLTSPKVCRPPRNSLHDMHNAQDAELSLPTYSDLKKELVHDMKAPLNEHQWNIADAKAQILKKVYKIHQDMSLHQLIALLIYCNYNGFREKLLSISIHWPQLLFSVIKQFGTTDQDMQTYCALNIPYTFYSLNHFKFNGLFSTCNDISIVECSNTYTNGIILKLCPSSFGVAPCVHLSPFSDFKDEPYYLFGCMNGCVLQIDEICMMNEVSSTTNEAFITALQLLEHLVLNVSHVTNEQQCKWLQRSIDKAQECVHILDHMLRTCLAQNSVINIKDKDEIKLPALIETQLEFFRYNGPERENELCFDLSKMKRLPASIQMHFMMDHMISYRRWRRLFPHDEVLLIQNIERNEYESYINAFATFVIENPFSGGLQCVDIDTDNSEYDEKINDMIQHQNDNKFKYADWTLSYQCSRDKTYCITIKKDDEETSQINEDIEDTKEMEIDKDDVKQEQTNADHMEDTKEMENDVKTDETEIVYENIQETEEVQPGIVPPIRVAAVPGGKTDEEVHTDDMEDEDALGELNTTIGVGTLTPAYTLRLGTTSQTSMMREEDEKKEVTVPNKVQTIRVEPVDDAQVPNDAMLNRVDQLLHPSSVASILDTSSPNPFMGRWGNFDSLISVDGRGADDTNKEGSVDDEMDANDMEDAVDDVIRVETQKRQVSSTKITVPTIDVAQQDNVLSNVIAGVDQLKATSSVASLDLWDTNSNPFAGRWGNFDSSRTGTENDDSMLDTEDKIWNAYIDKFGHEPDSPTQLQRFSHNGAFETEFTIELAKKIFNERVGTGKTYYL